MKYCGVRGGLGLRRMMQIEAAATVPAAGRCQVCGRVGGGPIVSCRRCRSEVHTDCYTMRKGADQEWLCDACNDGIDTLRCDLCQKEWTAQNGWQPILTKISSSYIHMICAKVKYRRGRLPQNAQCTVCQQGTGKLLGCQDPSKCRELCHASCALFTGLMDGFSFKCRQHRSGLVAVHAEPTPTPVVEKRPARISNEPAPSIFDHDSVLDLKSVEAGIFADSQHKVENSIFDDQEPKPTETRTVIHAEEKVTSIIFEQTAVAGSDQPVLINEQTALDELLVQSQASHEDKPVDAGDQAGGHPSLEAKSSATADGTNLPERSDDVIRNSLCEIVGSSEQTELFCDKLLTNIIDRCCEDIVDTDAPLAKKPRN